MQPIKLSEVTLDLDCDNSLTPMVTSFVENAARCYDMDPAGALDLTLSSEEIFTYLCYLGEHSQRVKVSCRYGVYFVELEFQFKADDFDLSAFNLTSSDSISCGEQSVQTGLLIASRLVDRFSFSRRGGVSMLSLVKEKSYPSSQDFEPPRSIGLGDLKIRKPDTEEVKSFARRVQERYDPCVIPLSFETPGKVADMESCGKYFIAIAVDSIGTVGGGILWTWVSERLVEFYGPYVLRRHEHFDIPQQLIEHMIAAVARTSAIGIVTRLASPELRTEYFQAMGNLRLMGPGNKASEGTCYYRHLREDSGTLIWAHPLIKGFLEKEYERHFFAREIKTLTDEGEQRFTKSVIAAEVIREVSTAVLKPVWWARDDSVLVPGYVSTLLKEGLLNIIFEMDLGRPWEGHFTEALLDAGFEPRLVFPYAGTGDILIFQYSGRVEGR